MNAYKKQHNIWHVELKEYFHILFGDVPFCERCNTSKPPIDMAHSRKRWDIKTKEEYFHAAMLCRQCHKWVEFGVKKEEMFRRVSDIIDKRM